jgi:hypothetical protein
MGGLYNPPLLQNPADPMWNAGSLQGREIADTAPTDGQALIWSVVQNKWVPGAGGAGSGSVSWDDIDGRPDLSVYVLPSALNNYVLGSDLATILGGYVTNSGLSTALGDYLLSADFTWGNLGGKPDLSAGMTLLGRTKKTNRTTANGLIPFDDSVPQNTEGTEFMTVTVTPSASDKTLLIRMIAWLGETSNTSNQIAGAVFVDSEADAIISGWLGTAGAGGAVPSLTNGALLLEDHIPAQSTNPRTYRFRAGSDNGNAISVNGVGSTRRLGGTAISYLEVWEY